MLNLPVESLAHFLSNAGQLQGVRNLIKSNGYDITD
jgi:hypothetical protein